MLVIAQTPHFKISSAKPFALAYLIGLAVYVFVMPQLSVFLELGLVIFLFTFLAAWGGQIDQNKFINTSAQQIGDMVATLQTLTYRIEELEDARIAPQSAMLTMALVDERREWRYVFEGMFSKWSVQPEAESADVLRGKLSARFTKLNAQFEEMLNSIGNGAISEEEGRNFYQLLGRYRGLAQAGIAYADAAGDIDWLQWRDEKF